MREIKFRGKDLETGDWIEGNYYYGRISKTTFIVVEQEVGLAKYYRVGPSTVGQYTGLKDKNGKEIYEGDELKILIPIRTTQTHTGDNIPNGSYTEPMEPGIDEIEAVVVFEESMFQIKNFDNDQLTPLYWMDTKWDLELIEEAIAYGKPDAFIFDDPEEGDLQYLIEDVAKVKDAEELIKYLSGVEIIGNIHEEQK